VRCPPSKVKTTADGPSLRRAIRVENVSLVQDAAGGGVRRFYRQVRVEFARTGAEVVGAVAVLVDSVDHHDAFADGLCNLFRRSCSAGAGVAGSCHRGEADVVAAVVGATVLGAGESGDVEEAGRGRVALRVQ